MILRIHATLVNKDGNAFLSGIYDLPLLKKFSLNVLERALKEQRSKATKKQASVQFVINLLDERRNNMLLKRLQITVHPKLSAETLLQKIATEFNIRFLEE